MVRPPYPTSSVAVPTTSSRIVVFSRDPFTSSLGLSLVPPKSMVACNLPFTSGTFALLNANNCCNSPSRTRT